MTPSRLPKTVPGWFSLALRSIAVISAVAFASAYAYFGGEAQSGGIRDGHYFLSSHGTHTEVSYTVFRTLACLEGATRIFIPMAMCVAFATDRGASHSRGIMRFAAVGFGVLSVWSILTVLGFVDS